MNVSSVFRLFVLYWAEPTSIIINIDESSKRNCELYQKYMQLNAALFNTNTYNARKIIATPRVCVCILYTHSYVFVRTYIATFWADVANKIVQRRKVFLWCYVYLKWPVTSFAVFSLPSEARTHICVLCADSNLHIKVFCSDIDATKIVIKINQSVISIAHMSS